jgi:hypothetical protein
LAITLDAAVIAAVRNSDESRIVNGSALRAVRGLRLRSAFAAAVHGSPQSVRRSGTQARHVGSARIDLARQIDDANKCHVGTSLRAMPPAASWVPL